MMQHNNNNNNHKCKKNSSNISNKLCKCRAGLQLCWILKGKPGIKPFASNCKTAKEKSDLHIVHAWCGIMPCQRYRHNTAWQRNMVTKTIFKLKGNDNNLIILASVCKLGSNHKKHLFLKIAGRNPRWEILNVQEYFWVISQVISKSGIIWRRRVSGGIEGRRGGKKKRGVRGSKGGRLPDN